VSSDEVAGKDAANETHYEVGRRVRRTATSEMRKEAGGCAARLFGLSAYCGRLSMTRTALPSLRAIVRGSLSFTCTWMLSTL